MILNIKQIEFGAEPEFEIENAATQEILAKCKSMNNISTELVFSGENVYTLSFEPVLLEKKGEKNELMYGISEHNKPVGGLYTAEVCQKKILFVSVGYDYYKIQFYDREYQLYEIGLGTDRHYLCLYEDGQTVAIVHKPTEVKSHLDTYMVYLENVKYRHIACIAALFIDGLEYSSNDEIADSAIKEEYLSFNKELNSKFDAAFLERVKANNM